MEHIVGHHHDDAWDERKGGETKGLRDINNTFSRLPDYFLERKS